MEKELRRLQKLGDLNIDFEHQKQKLEPYVELAKYITDSPVCEINLTTPIPSGRLPVPRIV